MTRVLGRRLTSPKLPSWPMGCGVDVVELDRFHRAIRRGGAAFLRRIFTEREQQYCRQHRDRVLRLAARFAAKEAVIKAMGQIDPNRVIGFKQIEVCNDTVGRPYVTLHDRASSPLLVSVSLSHAHRVAVASAVVIRDGASLTTRSRSASRRRRVGRATRRIGTRR